MISVSRKSHMAKFAGVGLLLDGLEVMALVRRMLVVSCRRVRHGRLRGYPALATSFSLLLLSSHS